MTGIAFDETAKACEILTFRVYGSLRRRKDAYRSDIFRVANSIMLRQQALHITKQQICGWLADMAPMRAFLHALADGGPKYGAWSLCYYFLYEYELANSPAGVPPLPWAATPAEQRNTQEHILPQGHRDGGWWEQRWQELDAERVLHRLGNLTLTCNNIALGRKPFPAKLNDAGYCYNHQNATNSEKRIEQYTDGQNWNRANILRRERAMLEFAAERWNLGCCSDNGPVDLPEVFVVDGQPLPPIVVQRDDCIPPPDDDHLEVEDLDEEE
jgi:hypothetical protein